MQSLFRDSEAPADLLELRAYTSRLLGRDPSLVLHGGGNTSVKLRVRDFYGDEVDVLYVKGTGSDLASIEPRHFAPVRLAPLLRLAERDAIGDADLVREQRAALLDPGAPDPSIEAVLHALVPLRFVDHTHADAVVALSNTPGGEERLRELYGERVLLVPYVMPGFALAREVRRRTRDLDLRALHGIVLLHHGVFSFADDARESYERMIRLVDLAEGALARAGAFAAPARADAPCAADPVALAELRREVSRAAGRALVARHDGGEEAVGFARRADAGELAARGPVTPDHVIRTKRAPAVVAGDARAAIDSYAAEYRAYFARHDDGSLAPLDPAPRWAVWRERGLVSFGSSMKAAGQVADIARHAVRCFQWGEALGGWRPLGEAELFAVEYWELEQRKLREGAAPPPLAGRIALVTGGASGIGRAVAGALRGQGAAVGVLDVAPAVAEAFRGDDALGVVCDVRDPAAVEETVHACVRRFGGLDVLVASAGDFPPTRRIAELADADWERTLDLNAGGALRVLRAAAPFLERGVEPCVVVIASRNVPAPGAGAAAYSASKAALVQLARVAALELAPKGVRVNVIHPDKVFDTGLWTDEKVEARARSYGQSPEAYRRGNLLGVEVTSADVAALACAMVGPAFRCTTGAQVPVDGGSDRVV